MDATDLAREMLESIPANAMMGISVLTARDGHAEVGLQVRPPLTNVIGSLHSSGLICMTDAVGLAALLSAARVSQQVQNVQPLGSDADLTFFAPAQGMLTARCTLDEAALRIADRLFCGSTDRIALMSEAEIVNEDGAVVCTGRFRWRVKRLDHVAAS